MACRSFDLVSLTERRALKVLVKQWIAGLLKCLLLLFIEEYLVLEAVFLQFWCIDLFGFLFLLIINGTVLPQADTSDLLYSQPCHAHNAVPILE